MIKKFITIFIIFVLSTTSAFTVTVRQEAIPVTYAADVPSVIGFSSTAVDFATPVTNLNQIKFKVNDSGKFVSDEFFIYWQLFSTDRVLIRLEMQPLTYGGNTIHYKVNDIYELNEANTASNSIVDVINDSGKNITNFRMESIPLSLVFSDSSSTPSTQGEYKGKLILTLESI